MLDWECKMILRFRGVIVGRRKERVSQFFPGSSTQFVEGSREKWMEVVV